MFWSCFSEDKIPSSFKNEIESVSWDSVVIRSNLRNMQDCNKWVAEFGNLTNTKWNTRTSKPCRERFICSKKFVCHHSSFHKIPADLNKRNFSKNLGCLATIFIKVKKETSSTRQTDSFIQKGLPAIIRIDDVHNHNVNTEESVVFLPTAECKKKFIEYFNAGMGIAESCRYHKSILLSDDNISDLDMVNSRINPSNRAVCHWYVAWRQEKLGSRTENDTVKIIKDTDPAVGVQDSAAGLQKVADSVTCVQEVGDSVVGVQNIADSTASLQEVADPSPCVQVVGVRKRQYNVNRVSRRGRIIKRPQRLNLFNVNSFE